MPKVEIAPGVEIDVREDGVVETSTLPEKLKPIFEAEFNRAFGKGAAKASEESKKQLEAAVADARAEAKKSGGDPVLAERAKNLERELSKLREEEATRTQNHQEAQRLRDERHANELKEREDKLTESGKEIERRTSRIRELVTAEIRISAQRHGARDASLPELDVLLRQRIGLDEHLQAFVKDEKDPEKPAVGTDGKTPVTIDGFVQQYLADHPHHKAPAGGRGGGASGGSSFAGGKPGERGEFATAAEKVAHNPTVANVADAFSKIGTKAS